MFYLVIQQLTLSSSRYDNNLGFLWGNNIFNKDLNVVTFTRL